MSGFIGTNNNNVNQIKNSARGVFTEKNPLFDIQKFYDFFPNFSDFEPNLLNEYKKIATAYINIGYFPNNWEYAVSLYLAHLCTIFNQMVAPEVEEGQPAGGSGTEIGIISSKSAGDVSVSYDLSTVNSIEGYEFLKQTKYGIMLIGLIKQSGIIGGVYI